jgi:energy-coupling factor transporter ATP-binding protein EcfA2
MRIQDLEIDRFGVWQGVRFTFQDGGLSVLHGPNEAGKSTLMRFIRGILYGYHAADERTAGPSPKPVHCSGKMRIIHRGELHELRRSSHPGTRGKLEINGRTVADDDPFPWTLDAGAQGVQLAEVALRAWRERRWLDVPALGDGGAS